MNLKQFSAKLRCNDIRFIPISALKGDNVTTKSQKPNGTKVVICLVCLKTLKFSQTII